MTHGRWSRYGTALTVLGLCAAGAPAGVAAPSLTPNTPAGLSAGAPILTVANGFTPALSGNARFLAYETTQPSATGRARTVLGRRDVVTGQTVVVNQDMAGAVPAGRFSLPPIISASGARVAYSSNAAGLVAGDDNGRSDAFVRDIPSGATILVSRALDGAVSAADTGMVALADGGRFAVFTSGGTDLVAGSTTTNTDVFRRDLLTGTTIQVSVRPDGSPSRGPGSQSADVSANGRLVAFNSYDSDLVPGDLDTESDLFIRDLTLGTTRLLTPSLPSGANPSGVVLSPDGRWVSSRWADGSLHLTAVATATTVEVAPDGYATGGSFSADGGLFVYSRDGHPVVLDLTTQRSLVLDVPTGGDAASVAVSGDGRTVAYGWVSLDATQARIYRVTLTRVSRR